MPRKVFSAGEILTAADVNTYLGDQTVMTFAGTAARGSAISSPTEGMFTYLADTNLLEYWDGSAWVQYRDPLEPGDNLVYNGAMQVHQRGTAVTGITSGGYHTADRFNFSPFNFGTWTNTIENDGPSGSGLTKSFKVLCTTAEAAPASASVLYVYQRLEGQDVQNIAKGTPSAKSLTLSFWVKANVTGTYTANVLDSDNSRMISFAYSVAASGTWEKKTVTFGPDTTGIFSNDNGSSLQLEFWLGAGSNFSSGTLQTSWGSTVNANRAVGQTNLAAATNNYWQVTGVQLEVGSVASPFEFKPYGQELAECQRYYYRASADVSEPFGSGMAYATTNAIIHVSFPVEMRVAPTALEQSGTASHYRVLNSTAGNVACNGVPTFSVGARNAAQVIASVDSGLTAGNATLMRGANAAAYLGWSAEL